MLRQHGVVGKFVEFYGDGVAAVPLANRATIGNMSPEYGSTAAIFPIDEETLRYLRLTGRTEEQVALVEAYAKEQGLWHDPAREPVYSEYLELDLATVVPSHRRAEASAGPGRARPRPRPRSAGAAARLRRRDDDELESLADEGGRRDLPGLATRCRSPGHDGARPHAGTTHDRRRRARADRPRW